MFCLPIIICELLMPKYEMILSVAKTNIDPSKNPPATGMNAYSPFLPYMPELTASSMAGASRDQNDAAIMTPAAKPSAMSSDFRWNIQDQISLTVSCENLLVCGDVPDSRAEKSPSPNRGP